MNKWMLFLFFSCFLANTATAQTVVKPADSLAKNNRVTGILGAFGDEVTLLLTLLTGKKEDTVQHIIFTRGILNGRQVVIARTGIGKVNAAIATTLLLEHYTPAEVLFSGIAGGVNPALSPGDLVIGTTVAYHDYGTITADSMMRRPTINPITLKDNPLYFSCDERLVKLAKEVSKTIALKAGPGKQSPPKITEGTIVTGDVFVSSQPATKALRLNMNAEATEMEGAAVAQVCWQQRVPFLVIRSLSDNANSNAHNDVATFYQVAALNSASFVAEITGMLAKTP